MNLNFRFVTLTAAPTCQRSFPVPQTWLSALFIALFGWPILSGLDCDNVLAQDDAKIAADENAAGADEAEPVDLKSDVLEWLDELDAASLSKRKNAEKKLVDAGPAALEFLPESKAGLSIEASERLARVRSKLLAMKATTKVTDVVVRLDNVTDLSEALEAISRDSGVEFEGVEDSSVPIQSVKTPLSFWHAVDLVLDQANLDVNFYAGEKNTLALVPRQELRPSRVDSAGYAGVYRIEPTSINSRRVLNQPDQSALNISMEIAWEPRLTPIGLTIPVDQLSGVLDDGQVIKPQDSGGTIDIATNNELCFSEFYLPLQLPSDQPASIDSLRGVIQSLLPGKSHNFELALADPGKSEKVDAMEVKLEDVRQNGGIYEVRVGIEIDDADKALESHRQWIFQNRVYAILDDGSTAEHLGFELYRQTENSIGVGYLFDLGEVGKSKLVYQSPTSVVQNEVPFVLNDIPLP